MLKVENLSFTVGENGSKINILSDVSFNVNKGEMLVITGPNGGGKSTLAKVLMGIEKADCGKREDLLPMLMKQGPSCCAFLRNLEQI